MAQTVIAATPDFAFERLRSLARHAFNDPVWLFFVFTAIAICDISHVMKKVKDAVPARRDLEESLKKWRRVPLSAPPEGWIRAIREALGMTADDLARRMKMSQTNLSSLEASEVKGVIQIDSLRRVARAMDCDLAYALVPRRSLDKIIEKRKRSLAFRQLSAAIPILELAKPEYKELIGEYAKKIGVRHLWRDGV